MIAFLTHADIDKKKWDRCIDTSNNRLIYAYSWYLDVVSPQWNALVLNDYEAVMPLPTVKKIFTMAYQPFFTQQLGIFSSRPGEFHTTDFIGKIPSRYKYINICINENNDPGLGRLRSVERDNYILYLHQPYEETAKHFTDHCRRNIKRAEKEKLGISEFTAQEVVDFYIQHKGPRTEGVKHSDYEVLKKVLLQAADRDMLKTYKITNAQGDIVAAAAFYVQPHRIIYQIGTASENGRELRAMYFLFNTVIRQNSSQEVILDFEGSDITNIARFFTGFGALCMPYNRIIVNNLPWPFNWLKK